MIEALNKSTELIILGTEYSSIISNFSLQVLGAVQGTTFLLTGERPISFQAVLRGTCKFPNALGSFQPSLV